MLTNILTAIHLIASVSIIVLVLLQRGRGADMGAAFGGGSSQSLFGSRGSANFLSRTTSILAVTFFVTGLSLAYLYAGQSNFQSVTEAGVESVEVEQEAPRGGALPEVPGAGDVAGEASATPDVPRSDGATGEGN